MLLYFLLGLPVVLVVVLFLLIRFHAGFKRKVGKHFYEWLYGLRWGNSEMNNYGFAPVGAAAEHLGGHEKYQVQLYGELGEAIPVAEWQQLEMLEVGCGRGGGIRFLVSTLKPKSATGLDFSHNAIRYCSQRNQALGQHVNYLQGDAHALPFREGSFDVVINVESSHIYEDQAQFFREVKRVLRPGGRFVVADYRLLGTEGMDKLHADLGAAGLRLVSERDISDQVLAACKLDSGRREAMIHKAPGFIRWYLRDFAMVDGSREYVHFKETYRYFVEVWV